MNALVSLSVPFILASESPRRRALLEQMGLAFHVQSSPADEDVTGAHPPDERAQRLAHRKATPVAEAHPSALTLAADTIVGHDGEVLEKPQTAREANAMLRRLSGSTHTVYTGFALHHPETDRAVVAGDATEVTFGELSDREIQAYVETESPLDKAGAYGIQDHTGPLFVDHLEGDYYTVVGLPLRQLYLRLRDDFHDLLQQSS